MNRLIEKYSQYNVFGTENGMVLNVVERGTIIYTMKVLPKHMATPFAAHGGIIAALMDGVLGVAALSEAVHNKCACATVEFKINYFEPTRLDDELVGTGKVLRAGKRIIYSEGEIVAVNRNVVIARGSGTFNAYPAEKAGYKIDF